MSQKHSLMQRPQLVPWALMSDMLQPFFCFGIAGVIFTGPMADFRLPMKADRLGFVVFLIAGGWLATGSLYNALMLVGVMFSVWIGLGFI